MYSYSYNLGWQTGYYSWGDEEIYCPFPVGSYEYDEWWEGFDDGEDDCLYDCD